tara:strand:+ start:76871 stop:77353 length:483 start_codon:yes stop_codon:yes gene_type:complete
MGAKRAMDLWGSELVASNIFFKFEESINPKDWERVWADYSLLRGFWSRSYFVTMLMLNKDESFEACGKKLLKLLERDKDGVYTRQIKPYISQIKSDLANDPYECKPLISKIKNSFIDFGEKEFIILVRVTYSTKYNFLDNMTGVSLTSDEYNNIKNDLYE